MKTKQETLCRYLEMKGLRERDDKSSKRYRVFQIRVDWFYFVGTQGALRVGRTVTTAHSLTDRIKWPAIRAFVENQPTVKLT